MKNVKRLIEQFVPENYQLHITPDAEGMKFAGWVEISGQKTGRPSQRLTFHQKNLKITKAEVTKHDKKGESELEVVRINTQNTLNEVRVHTNEMVYPGKYVVKLWFEGKINAKAMNGLYPCYFTHEGKKKKLLATQFESHYAREVFPCIDEPKAKATFDLSVTSPKNDIVLSNMPAKEQKAHGEKMVTTFETTPIMSSYLLALVMGEMHCVTGKTKNGVTISSWATLEQPRNSLEYANKEAIDILEYFEDYFGTQFPLKKCDQVALPDFEAGAMENWGLITYRESFLLTDPVNRSIPSEQLSSMGIGHEMSHQWFGDLVTMEWWDDLWLNESFASIMEHIVLDALHPEWHQWEQYVSSDVIASSNRDIYKDVQSVKTPVHHPDEIGALFDGAIVYAKGGRLLKMMIDYIGKDAFKRGLRNYFEKFAYKNTVRDDLWAEMSAASGKDINALMDPWLEQSGMPVLRVSKDGEKTERTLTQSRFVLDKNDDTQLWPIPLLSKPTLELDLLDKPSATVTLPGGELPLINSHGSGHYVVHYSSDDDLKLIIDKIQSGSIDSEARINILNDFMLLARRGDDSLADALMLVRALSGEPREPVWAMMARAIGLAGTLGEHNKVVEEGLKKFRYELAHKNYEKLGWDDVETDDPNTKMLRATTIGLMLGAEDQAAIDHALELYADTKELEDLPADRRGLVLGAVVRHGNKPADIDRLIKEYKTSPNPDLQLSISGALTHTRDEAVTERLINEALGPDGFVRPQDIFRWHAYLMRNKYTREAVWQWLVESWSRLEKDFGGGKSLDYFVIYAAAPLQTKEWEKRFHEFFEDKRTLIELQRKIDIAYSEIAARIAWRERDLPNIEKFFTSL